ncbi:GPI ethanolamine phosphate transferase 1 [Striga asiatica]|uniref:GPI ethanolamine phosphate transferase 1 n=1 Tax=Striga asiatica TaxID=4170 RepID=A0A5A7PQT5_STRAF|nr:GPI ethanolamine phosphate transferase 1 [Striga asiatica]
MDWHKEAHKRTRVCFTFSVLKSVVTQKSMVRRLAQNVKSHIKLLNTIKSKSHDHSKLIQYVVRNEKLTLFLRGAEISSRPWEVEVVASTAAAAAAVLPDDLFLSSIASVSPCSFEEQKARHEHQLRFRAPRNFKEQAILEVDGEAETLVMAVEYVEKLVVEEDEVERTIVDGLRLCGSVPVWALYVKNQIAEDKICEGTFGREILQSN